MLGIVASSVLAVGVVVHIWCLACFDETFVKVLHDILLGCL